MPTKIKGGSGVTYFWNEKTGKWETSGRIGDAPVIRFDILRQRFICDWRECSDLEACVHLMRFFQDYQDIGVHSNFHESNLKKRMPGLWVPLSFGVQVPCARILLPSFIPGGGTRLSIETDVVGIKVITSLGSDDGLIQFIRMIRDEVMGSATFDYTMDALKRRVRMPCQSYESHRRAADRETTNLVRKYAIQFLGDKDWNRGNLEPAFTELAIDNAVSVHDNKMCISCHRTRVTPDHIPDDLIPKV